MKRFSMNMRYGILEDSKGDMDEATRQKLMHQIEETNQGLGGRENSSGPSMNADTINRFSIHEIQFCRNCTFFRKTNQFE